MNRKLTCFRRFFTGAIPGILLAILATGAGPGLRAATFTEQLIDTTQAYLESTVDEYLQQNGIQARHEIEVNRLDTRLQLADCDMPLGARLESPLIPVGRVTVRVQCDSAQPWTVFVPARVRLFREVVVALRPLRRNALIQAEDVSLAERDTGLLSQGYLTGLEQVIGNSLTRPIRPDQAIPPAAVRLPVDVRKGDQVVIQASGPGISVRMSGEALSGGARGQQIRVRNLSSGRTLRATVTAPGQVEVHL